LAQEAAIVEQMAGDPEAAEAVLRPAFERFEQMGEVGFKGTIAAMLVRSLFEQGRAADARSFAEIVAGDGAVYDDQLTAGVHALVAAQAGDTAAAVILAEEAVALISTSDFLRDNGDRLLDLARVLRLAGRHGEARAALARADALYERKGCTAALKTTAALRAQLA
jgi:tetratricopeptide (TPR) repeat protein